MNEFARELTALVWAMESRSLEAMIGRVASVTQEQIDSKVRAIQEKPELLERLHKANGYQALNSTRRAYDVADNLDVRSGVAHIVISGPMMKQVPSIFEWLGIKATSTEAAIAELTAAVDNDRVESIVLDIDSPGGTVDGTAALADTVAAIRGLKPITASVPDLCASAAMWIAAQAESIDVGPSASVGSIGVYMVVDDTSRQNERKGVKTHVVSSGGVKGAGVAGTEITDAQLDAWQANIDTYKALFVSAVAEGRGMDEADVGHLATGQMWIGAEAIEIGLADSVQGRAEVARLAHTQEAIGSSPIPATNATAAALATMADAVLAPFAELKEETNAALPAAQQETETMTEEERKELEGLRADKAAQAKKSEATAAELEAKNQVIADMKAGQISALMDTYADRFEPAAADTMRAWGEQMDNPAAFEDHLKTLPRVTRPDRESVTPDANDIVKTIVADQAESALAEAMGVNVPHHRKLEAYGDKVKSVRLDGTCILYDGREIAAADIDKALGLN